MGGSTPRLGHGSCSTREKHLVAWAAFHRLKSVTWWVVATRLSAQPIHDCCPADCPRAARPMWLTGAHTCSLGHEQPTPLYSPSPSSSSSSSSSSSCGHVQPRGCSGASGIAAAGEAAVLEIQGTCLAPAQPVQVTVSCLLGCAVELQRQRAAAG